LELRLKQQLKSRVRVKQRFACGVILSVRQFRVRDKSAEEVLRWTREEARRLPAVRDEIVGIGTIN
jgi:hypothetical protein